MQIRPFTAPDFPAWLPLWDGNNLGQRNEAVTAETWSRILDDNSQVFGLGAYKGDQLVGFVHYILHATTGAIEPVCYMQDVYVEPGQRGKGIGKRLVEAVAKLGKQEKWARIYWLADAQNEAAQKLYENFGQKLNFSLHVYPLKQT